MIKRICYTISGLCVLSFILPLVVYGFCNVGSVLLLLGGCCVYFLTRCWDRLSPLLRRGALVAGGIAACAALTFCSIMFYFAWMNPPPEEGVDVVLVLGAKVVGEEPALMLRQRLASTINYLNQHPETVCLVSGGQGTDEDHEEAYVMANYLISRGIDESRILLEGASTNTKENIEYSASILERKFENSPSVLIVTHDFHQLRASIYADGAGLQSHYARSVITPYALIPSYWVREWPAICKAWLFD